MKEIKTTRKMIGRRAYLEAWDPFGKELFKRILGDIHIEVEEDADRICQDGINIYICVIQMLDEPVDMPSPDHIKDIGRKLKKNGKGRMLLIINGFCRSVCGERWVKGAAVQEAVVKTWKNMAVEMGRENITCNIIEVGYMEERDAQYNLNSNENFFRRFVIRRSAREEDVSCAVQFLLSEEADYINGESLILDGGLELNQVISASKAREDKPFVQTESNPHSFDLSGKVAMVFGASSGIGKAAALELARRGATVSLHGRRRGHLENVAEEIEKEGGISMVKQVDVMEKTQILDAINHVWATFQKVDILVYASGIGYPTNELDDDKDYEKMYKTNYIGYKIALIELCKRWIEEGISGSAVGIATIDTLSVPYYGIASYSVSKVALVQLTKNLALLCGKHGIRLNCVSPGFISTEIMDFTTEAYRKQWSDKVPLKRLGKAEDLSGVICFLASSAADYITGKNIVVDGGYSLLTIPEIQ